MKCSTACLCAADIELTTSDPPGGGKAISGLLYNDNNAIPQRSKQCAWRARVETASSIAEIGLQVTSLDSRHFTNEVFSCTLLS